MNTEPTRRQFGQQVAGTAAVVALGTTAPNAIAADDPQPFGEEYPNLDSLATGEWWKKAPKKGPNPPPPMDVPRDRSGRVRGLYVRERRAEAHRAAVSAQAGRSARSPARSSTRRQVDRGAEGAGAVPRLERPLPRREMGFHQDRAVPRPARREGDVRRNAFAAIRSTRK